MWRKGFNLIGYTEFNSPNARTEDAIRFAKKLSARFLILHTRLSSSNTASIPLTLPNTTTSYTQGTASAYGSGGYANGTYSGTTTTYGSQTTYIPITVNRFDKGAMFFAEIPKQGAGILRRELNSEEIARLETRRGFVVRSVRDDSPAYNADILPGDTIIQINGQPADLNNWRTALRSDQLITMHLIRNGQPRDVTMSIPPEWRLK